MKRLEYPFWALLLCAISATGPSSVSRAATPDYTEMSLEELMDVEVTSVSRRPQKASEAAAAVFVLTNEDIRRSGVTNIPDALRLVPGVEVARLNANSWAITIRGFNSRFANKLLVMIDGRSVYTPLFSGVFWDRHDLILEDIERIEVIRGPGAALWGANAVNGVINIITRHSSETQGTYVSGTTGNVENGIAEVRHGGSAGDTSYRVYAKGRLRDEGETESGAPGNDTWRAGLTGFRSDTDLGSDSLLVEGQYQWSKTGEQAGLASLSPPYVDFQDLDIDSRGGYLLGRWSRELDAEASLSFQGYIDHRQFEDPRVSERRDTVNMEFQHDFRPLEAHQFTWGVGYRMIDDEIDNSFPVTFDPDHRTTQLFSGFLQDTITLMPNELDLVLGSKLEHNDYTGFEVQPNARLLWQPAKSHTLWGSVARAVRTPSRAENDVRLNSAVVPPGTPTNPGPLPTVVAFTGDESAQSEKLMAYEIGYRASPVDWFSYDLATFYNDYSDLRAVSQRSPFLETSPRPPHFVSPLVIDNSMTAETYGFELVTNWQMRPWWRWQTTYSFLEIDADVPSRLDSSQVKDVEEASPQQQASLRTMVDITERLTFDATVRYVDQIEAFGVDAYTALDLRIAWRPLTNVELALVGRNLLDPTHPEFGSEGLFPTQTTEAERSFYVTISAKF